MANKDLQLKPHNISPDQWWYEEPKGISVVTDCRKDGAFISTTITFISWRALRSALKRKEKKN